MPIYGSGLWIGNDCFEKYSLVVLNLMEWLTRQVRSFYKAVDSV